MMTMIYLPSNKILYFLEKNICFVFLDFYVFKAKILLERARQTLLYFETIIKFDMGVKESVEA